jgi:hypothetical protein
METYDDQKINDKSIINNEFFSGNRDHKWIKLELKTI